MSNQTIELLKTHRSDRSFLAEPVSDAILSQIIESAHRGPTSTNAQHISLVVVRDPVRRARIAEIANGQAWIAQAPVFITVVVDFYKTRLAVELAGKKQVINTSAEGFATGAVDAGITLSNLMVAARALGLGIVPIGGIRQDSQAMIDLLELPPLTFPMVGVCLGYVDQPARQKPRLNIDTFQHNETYKKDHLLEGITAYDEELMAYWQAIGRTDGLPWSQNTANAYQRGYSRQTAEVAHAQGFSFDQ
ncbi:MAG: NADPH-dependent oxidoreductase [Betaproteobacteria bacterium]